MADRGNDKARPSGSVKRTNDVKDNAAVEGKASGPGTFSGEADKKPKQVWTPITKIYHGKSNEI